MAETFGIDEAAHEAARTMILDAAAEVFQQRGFTRTTIDDIADRIGATKGRVYYYFRSKFDIYLAVYEHGMRLVRDAAGPAVNGPGTGLERLTAVCEAHAQNLMTHLTYHNAIHQSVNRQSAHALKAHQAQQLTELNGLREDYEVMFRSVVEDGIADGTLRADDPHLMARMLLSSLNSIDAWFRPRPGQDAAELRDLAVRITRMLISGVRAQRTEGG